VYVQIWTKGKKMTPVLKMKMIQGDKPDQMSTLKAEGGLHYILGNSAPHFHITATVTDHRGQFESGGCQHELILQHFPQFADLVSLHLSDISGVPMHAAADGWWRLAGALPENAGERYNAGNSKRHMPKPEGAPRRGDWDNTDHRKPTPDECLSITAEFLRITAGEALLLRELAIEWALVGAEDRAAATLAGESVAGVRKALPVYDWANAKREFSKWVQSQHPRWEAEARACIAKHGLVVFGGEWVE
jgi:hypothetical protein